LAIDPQNADRILLGMAQNGVWLGEPCEY